jgi:small subunit ribosomal protein S7
MEQRTQNKNQNMETLAQKIKKSRPLILSDGAQARIQNKCINLLTKDGKKTKAFSLLKAAFILVVKKTRKMTSLPLEFKGVKKNIPTFSNQGSPSTPIERNNTGNTSTAHVLFLKSIENVKPIFEVKKVRVAGNTLLVPALVPFQRQENKALRWIIEGAKERKLKNSALLFEECLAIEIIEASEHQGYARQKRDELHKIAEANRAFSHYKWW